MIGWIWILCTWAQDLCIEPEFIAIPTSDGARACAQHFPHPGHPVILVHGISSNHHFWNLNPQYSLALYLQKKGYEVYNIDLRGHGHATHDPQGKKQDQGWSVDDYGTDIHAVVQHIQKTKPHQKPFYVGHSLGGLAFISYMATHGTDSVQGAIIVASPFDFRHPEPLLKLAKIGAEISIVPIPTPFFARLASLFHSTPVYVDNLLWGVNTIDQKTRRELYQKIVSPMTPKELQQISKTLSRNAFSSLDDSKDYHEVLQKQNVPALFLAGRADRVAPVDRVLGYYESLGSTDKHFAILGKAYGFAVDYGHLDYALAASAPNEVFPLIESWIHERIPAAKELSPQQGQ